MDPLTGELTMVQPARSDLVEGGQFSVVIRATDGGTPPLHSDIQVKICQLLLSDIMAERSCLYIFNVRIFVLYR